MKHSTTNSGHRPVPQLDARGLDPWAQPRQIRIEVWCQTRVVLRVNQRRTNSVGSHRVYVADVPEGVEEESLQFVLDFREFRSPSWKSERIWLELQEGDTAQLFVEQSRRRDEMGHLIESYEWRCRIFDRTGKLVCTKCSPDFVPADRHLPAVIVPDETDADLEERYQRMRVGEEPLRGSAVMDATTQPACPTESAPAGQSQSQPAAKSVSPDPPEANATPSAHGEAACAATTQPPQIPPTLLRPPPRIDAESLQQGMPPASRTEEVPVEESESAPAEEEPEATAAAPSEEARGAGQSEDSAAAAPIDPNPVTEPDGQPDRPDEPDAPANLDVEEPNAMGPAMTKPQT